MVAMRVQKSSDDAPHPPRGPPPSRGVKRELGVAAQTGDQDRQAKIQAKLAQIRSEVKSGVVNIGVETTSRSPIAPSKVARGNTPANFKQEEADARKLEGLLPPLEEKITAAEEEAERIAILAAPLAMEPTPEIKKLQVTAIRETERAVKAAINNVAGARRELEKKQREIASFAPNARESAGEELGKLVSRLDEVQKKLEEHKTARKDHEIVLAAETLFSELSSRLASVEMDCEKAAMMAEQLIRRPGEEDASAAEIREAKEALRMAQATLAPTSRLIAGKLPGLKGAVKAKMVDLHSRAESAQAVLEKAQTTAEEAYSRIAGTRMLQEIAVQLATVGVKVKEMAESEGPFLMGIETMPGEEGSELIAKMEETAAAAHSAIEAARESLSLKSNEIGRSTDKAAEEARKEMERMKEELGEHTKRLRLFQADTARRKRANDVEVVRNRVEDATAIVQRLKDATEILSSSPSEEIKEALEKGHEIYAEAQSLVSLARQSLQDLRPPENNDKDSLKNSSEILKTKVQVSQMEGDVNKFKRVAKEIEEKFKVEASLTQVSDDLREAEREVEELQEISATWPTDERLSQEDESRAGKVQEQLSATTKDVERKLQKAQGLELKELRSIFNRLKASQAKMDKMKDKIKKSSRAHSAKAMKEISEMIKNVEAKLIELHSATSSKSVEVEGLVKFQSICETATALVVEAHKALEGAQPETSGLGVVLEAKVEYARLQLRLKGLERKTKKEVENFQRQFQKAVDSCVGELVKALRNCAYKNDGTYDSDSLFADISGGASEVTEEQVVMYLLARQPELPEEKVRPAFSRVAPNGLSRGGLAGLLSSFVKVVKEVASTDIFEIQTAKQMRQLEVGELVEVLSETKEDTDLGLERVQCRVVRDGITGWLTTKSKRGTSYVEPAPKPHLWCKSATYLTTELPSKEAADISGGLVRELLPGEVLDHLEGPHPERLSADLRVRGVACHEDTAGCLQVQGKDGEVFAKVSAKVFKCTEAIGMTDGVDFETCKMVRRIEVGEALEQLPDKAVEPAEGGTRQRFRACQDGVEGWVTVAGSQGTVYLRPAPKHYLCLKETPLHAGHSAASEVVRILMAGEAFRAFEEPKEVTGGDRRSFYKVRASTDGGEGWVTCTMAEEVQTWSKRYTILKSTPLTRTLAMNEVTNAIELIRELEPNETVEVTDPAVEDRSTGQLRIHCTALNDKVVGWATVREVNNSSAPVFMSPASGRKINAGAAAGAAPVTPPGDGKGSGKRWHVKQEIDENPAKRYKGKGKGKK